MCSAAVGIGGRQSGVSSQRLLPVVHGELVVYDVLGREVATLASGYREAGYHSATWNADGQASGVYFARFNVTSVDGKNTYSKINKLVLMK